MAIFVGLVKIVFCIIFTLIIPLIISANKSVDVDELTGEPTVLTSYGLVLGKWKNDVALFLGIPYAKPPIGILQFKVNFESLKNYYYYARSCT